MSKHKEETENYAKGTGVISQQIKAAQKEINQLEDARRDVQLDIDEVKVRLGRLWQQYNKAKGYRE